MISIFRTTYADIPLDSGMSDSFTIEHIRDLISLKTKMSIINPKWDVLDEWPFIIKEMQKIEDKTERNKLKTKLPAIVFAAKMRDKFVGLSQSGYYCVDIDYDDNSDFINCHGLGHLKQYIFDMVPSAMMCFISPSRNGLKVVHSMKTIGDVDTPYNTYLQVYDHFFAAYRLIGINIDTQCKNWNRLCYLSYDKEMLYREVEPLIVSIRKKVEKQSISFDATGDKYKLGGPKSKCPKCNMERRFRQYVDQNNNVIDGTGLCDRVNTCGHHVKPKDKYPNKNWRLYK